MVEMGLESILRESSENQFGRLRKKNVEQISNFFSEIPPSLRENLRSAPE